MNVLLVDDEVRVVQSLERILFVDGCPDWTIRSATSGADALEVLASEAIDVVVSDMRMPGMSGDQLLRRVRTEWPAVTRIVLSGHSDHDAELRSEQLAHQFLGKPCNASALVTTLEGLELLRAVVTDSARRAALGRVAASYQAPAAVGELASSRGSAAALDGLAALLRRHPGLARCMLALGPAPDPAASADLRAAIRDVGASGARAIALRLAPAVLASEPSDVLPRPVRVAALARRLAPAEDRATTVLAAALHDLGDDLVLPPPAAADRDHSDGARDEVAVEPAHVAGYLLALWGLPRQVVAAVVHGRGPFAGPPSPVIAAVHVAAALVADRPADPACLRALGHHEVPAAWRRWADGER